jgi:hypothetical protein
MIFASQGLSDWSPEPNNAGSFFGLDRKADSLRFRMLPPRPPWWRRVLSALRAAWSSFREEMGW